MNSPRFQGETGKLKRAISSPRGLSGQDSMGKLRIPRFSQALEADAIVNDGITSRLRFLKNTIPVASCSALSLAVRRHITS